MLSVANLSIPNHSNLENFKKKFEKVPERTKKPDEEKKLGEIMKEEQFVKTVNKASIEIQKKYNRKIDTFKNQLDSLRKEKVIKFWQFVKNVSFFVNRSCE